MDRQEMMRTGIIGHLHGLFGCAMGTNPWFVRADRHNRQIIRAAFAQGAKGGAPGSVAAKKDFLALAFECVAVVTTKAVPFPASAPVVYFKGAHFDVTLPGANPRAFTPGQSLGRFKARVAQQISCGMGGHCLRMSR